MVSNIQRWISPLVFVRLYEVFLDLGGDSDEFILVDRVVLVLVQIILDALQFG